MDSRIWTARPCVLPQEAALPQVEPVYLMRARAVPGIGDVHRDSEPGLPGRVRQHLGRRALFSGCIFKNARP